MYMYVYAGENTKLCGAHMTDVVHVASTHVPTTPVVPSPTSSSWLLDSSTSSLAIWCWTSILLSMVAPSFVTVTSPSGLTSILSMPLGPSEVRRVLETTLAAKMCDWGRYVFVWLGGGG